MQHRHVLIALFLLLFAIPVCATQTSISGRILSDTGQPLAGATVQANGIETRASQSGHFSLQLEPADSYLLRFTAESFFPMNHSFSALELTWLQQADGAVIPDVTLVERKEGRIMLAFGGDTMMGRRFSKPTEGEPVLIREEHKSEDALALLQHIEPYLQLADYTSVNLETQVMSAEPEGNAPKSFVFFSPPELLHALEKSGVDYVTLGNNHTFDYLADGLDSTVQALNASGVDWSGAGRTEAESLDAHRATVGGHALSYLGYVGWDGNFSPNQVAQGSDKGGAAFGTTENISKTIRREVQQGYWPIVQYHGSREYADEPTLVTETRLKQSIDEGAIVAIGHHPHITQGFEIYKDRLIAYSMGNFMFDQFHYSTTLSYLLYVWMDGDRLHRAEVMPLHIKGYVPTPAMDSTRQAILKRAMELSARRGIALHASGGHAVIQPAAEVNRTPGQIILSLPRNSQPGKKTIWALNGRAWNDSAESIILKSEESARVRLGQNLLPGGHLESHFLFDAPDRSWIQGDSQSIVVNNQAPSGKNVMHLRLPVGAKAGRIGMRTFEYTFEPGTPSSFVVQARADKAATVTAYQQWRKRNENRLEALATAKLRPIGQLELEPGSWRELRFDFDSPRVTAISYRVVLEVSPKKPGGELSAWFDDIALIEWLSPPLEAGEIPAHVPVEQASHLGLASQAP